MPFYSYKDSVAMYLRKSRMDADTETVDETLARHEDTLMQTAERQELNITAVYKEVVSGEGLFTRPQMVRLLQDIEDDKYSAVLCVEIDRLGRSSQKDSGIILETLQEHGVFIITPSKTYDLNSEFDEQSVEMQSFIARQELKSIKRRLRRGAEKTLEQGYHITDPPYGYRRTYIDKRPTLEVCEEEAAVVRMIFDMYVNQGLGGQVIADRLNAMGLAPRKNDHFSRSTVQWFLQNPTYIGKIVWNKKHHIRKKTVNDKHRSVTNPSDKWIVADGIHQSIVTQEMFDRAREIRLTRAHPPTYTGVLKNPFAGLVYCKNCGMAMQRQFSAVSGNRLLCAKKGCTRSIKTEYVEQRILDILRRMLDTCSADITPQKQTEDAQRIDAIRTAIKKIEAEKENLSRQKSSLHDLLERGIYDVPTFLERSAVIADKLRAADSALAEQHTALDAVAKKPPISDAEPILRELTEHYDALSPAEQNAMLKKLIRRMTYNRTPDHKRNDFDLSIEWNYAV